MPRETSRDDLVKVHANSALPLIADENCLIETDVEKCHGVFHGINVKLCKCGGLTPALRMLRPRRVVQAQQQSPTPSLASPTNARTQARVSMGSTSRTK